MGILDVLSIVEDRGHKIYPPSAKFAHGSHQREVARL